LSGEAEAEERITKKPKKEKEAEETTTKPKKEKNLQGCTRKNPQLRSQKKKKSP